MVEVNDLSGSKVPEAQSDAIGKQIDEEDERRRWKTRLLRATATLIIIFYGSLLLYIVCGIPYTGIEHYHVLIVAILAAIPTLLMVNLFRVVRQKNQADDIESGPWYTLLKELVDAFKKSR